MINKNKRYKTPKGNSKYEFYLTAEVFSFSAPLTLLSIKIPSKINTNHFLCKYFDNIYCDTEYDHDTNTVNFILDPTESSGYELESGLFLTIKEVEKFVEKYIIYINPQVTLSINSVNFDYLDEDEEEYEWDTSQVAVYKNNEGWIMNDDWPE